MRIVIEIDDDKLREQLEEEVRSILVHDAVEAARKSWGEGYRFRTDTKAVMREIIRENMDMFADKAIAAAAKSIENRAIRQRMDAFFKEDDDD